ncbi:MAG TPA: DUF6794 domain-containing protein [Pyrinomonadaceae bacterium]|nr:DUF6794 domain-containing protein [Pyrinomonadaceae bacterium]
MKLISLIFAILLAAVGASGQAFSSAVEVVTVYSQNGSFYLKSIPFDNEFPSPRGKTSVYAAGSDTPLYVFDRGFDSLEKDSNNLILSDDGEVIFYAIPWDADEEKEDMKSVTIYKHGAILKSYTETEVNGCDKKRERCSLLYSNYEEVVDKEKSHWGTPNYKKVFRDGVDEKEKFLSDFPIFSYGDTVYLTDSKKQVHVFDLRDGSLVRSEPFDHIYEQIKDKGSLTKTKLQTVEAPTFSDFPKLKDGRDAKKALAAYLGMKVVDSSEPKDEQFKWYWLKLSGDILRDGTFKVESIETDDALPKDKIEEFFRTNRFDSNPVPLVFERWNVGEQYFTLRKSSDDLARKEKEEEKLRQRQELEERLTAENINGVYIPKNLGECFTELDKLLPEVDRNEMKALADRKEMIQYHMGLGLWMRNNWGLWGGSRLQKYFTDRGVRHPDNMSGVILYYYYDWLKGNKESWKTWESNPLSR